MSAVDDEILKQIAELRRQFGVSETREVVASTNPVTGTGDTNRVAYWSSASAITSLAHPAAASALTQGTSGAPAWMAYSSAPGAAAKILATDAGGKLQLTGLGLGVAPGSIILSTYANNINESVMFSVENTPHAVVINRVDNGNVHLSFNNITTGTGLTDGTDVGIEADGTFRIRQQENLPVEIYTNNTYRWTIQAAGHLVSGTDGTGAYNIKTAGVITVANTAPSIVLTDTTASAKSLTIAVDANAVNLRESAGAAGSLLALDLANNRVGVGTSPSVKFHVLGASESESRIEESTNGNFISLYQQAVYSYLIAGKRTGTPTQSLLIYAGGAERMRVTNVGNIKVAGSAVRGTTEGTNHIDIFDGTAPVGTLANGISLYSTAGELNVMDAAGNATPLSPHDKEGRWIFFSKNTVTGKVLYIDMEKMMKAINAKFDWDFVREYVEN